MFGTGPKLIEKVSAKFHDMIEELELGVIQCEAAKDVNYREMVRLKDKNAELESSIEKGNKLKEKLQELIA